MIGCVVFVSIESSLPRIMQQEQQRQQLPLSTSSTAATRRFRKLPVEEIGKLSTTSVSTTPPNSTEQPPPVYPNVLYVGAQKAGTSAVSAWLFLQTESVCHAEVMAGEPHYYDKEVHMFDQEDRFNKGKEFYAEHFKHCHHNSSDIILDATPNYFSWADRIHFFFRHARKDKNLLEDLKIMVSLRDPIARELSLYNHKLSTYYSNNNKLLEFWHDDIVKTNGDPRTFDEYVDEFLIPNLDDPYNGENFSLYARHLKEWFLMFPREQILVLGYDEFRNDVEKLKWRVKTFLGHWEFDGEVPLSNTQKFSQKVLVISCEAQEKLRKIFEPLNQELYDLLEEYPGPGMEQRPFPPFEIGECV